MEHIDVQKACECLECLVRESIYPLCIATFAFTLFLVIFIIGSMIIFGKEEKNDNQ